MVLGTNPLLWHTAGSASIPAPTVVPATSAIAPGREPGSGTIRGASLSPLFDVPMLLQRRSEPSAIRSPVVFPLSRFGSSVIVVCFLITVVSVSSRRADDTPSLCFPSAKPARPDPFLPLLRFVVPRSVPEIEHIDGRRRAVVTALVVGSRVTRLNTSVSMATRARFPNRNAAAREELSKERTGRDLGCGQGTCQVARAD